MFYFNMEPRPKIILKNFILTWNHI